MFDTLLGHFFHAHRHVKEQGDGNAEAILLRIIRDMESLRHLPPEAYQPKPGPELEPVKAAPDDTKDVTTVKLPDTPPKETFAEVRARLDAMKKKE